MRLGEIIRKWRLLSDITVSAAAQRIGIAASTLVHIEQGKVPDGKTLLKLMAWLFGTEADSGKQSTGTSIDDGRGNRPVVGEHGLSDDQRARPAAVEPSGDADTRDERESSQVDVLATT